MAYQQSVVAQDNAASVGDRPPTASASGQKYSAKAEQLQQNETDLSLRLTQADAAQRLAIKTRLSNLALDEATRKQLAGQLAAINSKENGALDAQRHADAATLKAYRAQLSAQTGAAMRTQVGAIAGQTRAKIDEAPQRGRGAAAQPGTAGAARPTFRPAFKRKDRGDSPAVHVAVSGRRQKTIADYNATKADLDRQFAASTAPTSARPARRPKNSTLAAAARRALQARSSTKSRAKPRASQRIADSASSSSTSAAPPGVTTSPTNSSRT